MPAPDRPTPARAAARPSVAVDPELLAELDRAMAEHVADFGPPDPSKAPQITVGEVVAALRAAAAGGGDAAPPPRPDRDRAVALLRELEGFAAFFADRIGRLERPDLSEVERARARRAVEAIGASLP